MRFLDANRREFLVQIGTNRFLIDFHVALLSHFGTNLVQITQIYALCKLIINLDKNDEKTGKSKRACRGRHALLEKVFCYLWGVAKNYIMYWGLQVLLYS